VTPLRLTRSLPARSTRWNLESSCVVRTWWQAEGVWEHQAVGSQGWRWHDDG
jgi:hypothetical protein